MGTLLLDGFVLGLQFGILGVGLTLVYGLGGVVNLAHGQMAVMAAIIAARLIDNGAPTAVAVAVGILAAGFLASSSIAPSCSRSTKTRPTTGCCSGCC